jgi:hypothetical protein
VKAEKDTGRAREAALRRYWGLTDLILDLRREGLRRQLCGGEQRQLAAWERQRARERAEHPGIEREPKPARNASPVKRAPSTAKKKASAASGFSSTGYRMPTASGSPHRRRVQYTHTSFVAGGLPGTSHRH